MTEFQPGDIVRLKCGSPDMVVLVPEEYRTSVTYFANGEIHSVVVPTFALVRSELPQPVEAADGAEPQPRTWREEKGLK